MRVPVRWLREYVKFRATAAQLAEKLTFSGLEVEAIETFGAGLDGVVVAEILRAEPLPGAGSLSLCEVSDGTKTFKVVCGARNFAVGDKVPFAPDGVTLPGGRTVKTAVVQGVESQGMLCAEDELGISADHSGLLILDRSVPAGALVNSVLGLPEDVLVIEVTPNRPDCLSMIGMAREVAALYGTVLKVPEVKLAEDKAPVRDYASVKVSDKAGCPRYTARVLSGVAVAKSPDRVRMRLLQSGLRPINNVVDVTNYVMLETGHPLHAFDRSLLGGTAIHVRRAAPGETMATLDGVPRKITPEMLVIADESRPVAVAGVMGGAGSEIRPGTTDVLIESACFKPTDVRKASRLLGLSTESSYRFERGVDVTTVEFASRRAAELMARFAGGRIAKGVIDVFPRKPAARAIKCRFERVRALYGVEVESARIVGIFKSLGLRPGRVTASGCSVGIPGFRPDLVIEADLIEEVARIHGLDKVPVRAPAGRIVPQADDRASRAVEMLRSALAALGLREAISYSFLAPQSLDAINPGDVAARVQIPNPVSADHSVLRNSLVPQMVETLGRNLFRQVTEAAMFELGRVFIKRPDGTLDEWDSLAVGIMGPVGRHGLDRRRGYDAHEMFLWLKGIMEGICSAMRLPAPEFTPTQSPWAEPGTASAIILAGTVIGCAGIVRRAVRDQWRMQKPVAILETRVSPLLGRVFEAPRAKPLPAFPSVSRDLAIIVDRGVRNADVMAVVGRVAPTSLTQVQLFDIYESEAIGAGKKSMAFSFTYRSSEGTLTDEEANRLHSAVRDGIAKELGAEVRER